MSQNKHHNSSTDSRVSSNPSKTSQNSKKKPDLNEAKLLNRAAVVRRRINWGADKPKFTIPLGTPVNKLVITWTETDPCYSETECAKLVRELQRTHMRKLGLPDIKHNFLIGGDGILYEGRGYTVVGPRYTIPKAQHLMNQSIEIAFIDKCKNKPSHVQLKVLSECFSFGYNGDYIQKNVDIYWLSQDDVIFIQPATLGP